MNRTNPVLIPYFDEEGWNPISIKVTRNDYAYINYSDVLFLGMISNLYIKGSYCTTWWGHLIPGPDLNNIIAQLSNICDKTDIEPDYTCYIVKPFFSRNILVLENDSIYKKSQHMSAIKGLLNQLKGIQKGMVIFNHQELSNHRLF